MGRLPIGLGEDCVEGALVVGRVCPQVVVAPQSACGAGILKDAGTVGVGALR